MKRLLVDLLPPIAVRFLRGLRHKIAAAHYPREWEAAGTDPSVIGRGAGWRHPSIAAEQKRKWASFVAGLAAPAVLGQNHEAAIDVPVDMAQHDAVMTFGYLLGRAAGGRRSLSVLDWGGGIGHYYALARVLRPDLTLDYAIKDVPEICTAGHELNPDCRFVASDEEALSRTYDLVYVSGSIHYARDVYALLKPLAAAARPWLMVTRVPLVERCGDFIVIQRPHAVGYLTEYAGWFLNRGKFLDAIRREGFRLEREFLLDERPVVPGAPEQCNYGSFLFERVSPDR